MCVPLNSKYDNELVKKYSKLTLEEKNFTFNF